MKLSSTTLSILKNFAEINGNLTIRSGNTLKTVHVPPTIYATATVDETFDRTFGIYDLKEFLATLAMFKNPTLTFTDNYIDIVDDDDGSIRTKYWSADTKILTEVPNLKSFSDPQVMFVITGANFKRIQRACATLRCPDVVFKSDDNKIVAVVCDLTNSTKNSFTVVLEPDYNGAPFNVHVREEKLMIIDGDYQTSVIDGKLLHFRHVSKPVEYAVALDV